MAAKKEPLKIGVRLEPPAVVYIYSESDQLRMRVMPLRNFWSKTDTDFALDELQNRHGKYLDSVPRELIKKMINIIKEHKQGTKLQDILKKYKNNSEIKRDSWNEKWDNTLNTHQRKPNTTFLEFNKNQPLKQETHRIESDDENQFEVKRNVENKKIHDKSSFPNKKSLNFTFSNNDSSSDLDELEYDNDQDDLKIYSDDDLEINNFLKEKEINKNNFLPNPSHSNENPGSKETPNLLIKDATKNMNNGNTQKTHKSLKTTTKNDALKELLDVHNKIESVTNTKVSKSEDDTDVEFDDSDIPLEEDFY